MLGTARYNKIPLCDFSTEIIHHHSTSGQLSIPHAVNFGSCPTRASTREIQGGKFVSQEPVYVI